MCEVVSKMRESTPMKEIRKAKNALPLKLVVAYAIVGNLTGIHAIQAYAVSIFRDSPSGLDPLLSTVLLGGIQCFFNVVSAGMVLVPSSSGCIHNRGYFII